MQGNRRDMEQSLGEVHETVDTTNAPKGWRRILAFWDQHIWSVWDIWIPEIGLPICKVEHSLVIA